MNICVKCKYYNKYGYCNFPGNLEQDPVTGYYNCIESVYTKNEKGKCPDWVEKVEPLTGFKKVWSLIKEAYRYGERA